MNALSPVVIRSIALACAAWSGVALAQDSTAPARPPLPTKADQWINSSPLTYESFEGKAVVMWYFEETCPSCEKKWTDLKQLAEDNADKPVLFVAVNSGADHSTLTSYLRRNEIDWPVIYDPDRSFEQASEVKEISLQNIYQVKIVRPDGQFQWGKWSDMPGTVEKALDGAGWKVKYEKLDPSMHHAVRRMEFGDYRPAALAIRDGLKSKSPEVRKAAQQTQKYVEHQMKQALDAALAGVATDDVWEQFEAYQRVADQFAPHKLPEAAAAKLKKLAAAPEVQKELRAGKAVDANIVLLQSPEERVRNRAAATLQRVIDANPETRAAIRAKAALESTPVADAAA